MELTGQQRVSIVAAVCLISLTSILKNVLRIPPQVFSRDIIVYIIIYSSFWIFLSSRRDEGVKRSRFDTPLFWSLLIIAITMAITALYAI
jgi:hypothetical protein